MARTSTPRSQENETEVSPLSPDALQAVVAAKLCAIIREAPALAKEERNAFAKYNYVPIDTYYEKFARLAASHGLTWVAREVECEVIDVVTTPEKRGRDSDPVARTMVRTTYAFDVVVSGAGILSNYSRITVMHALTGPQTAGSSASYAEKVFCRVAMKAVTGESDGDAEEPYSVQPGPNHGFPGPQGSARGERPDERRREPERVVSREPERAREPEPDDDVGDDSAGPPPDDDADDRHLADVMREHREIISSLEDKMIPVLNENGITSRDYRSVKAIFDAFAPTLDYENLQRMWKENEGVLGSIREDDIDTYNQIASTVKKRVAELNPKKG
jgi:hypothetical protein